MKEEEPGLYLLALVKLFRPSVRAREAEHAARDVEESIALDEHAPCVIRWRGKLSVYLRDYDRTSCRRGKRSSSTRGVAEDVDRGIKRPLFWPGAFEAACCTEAARPSRCRYGPSR